MLSHMLFLSCLFIFCSKISNGANYFESFGARLICYPEVQQNCPDGKNKDFIDEYPNMSMSSTNETKATTHFYLFTPCNPDVPELLHKCAGYLPKDSNFNKDCNTEIVLPGYISGICNFALYRSLKEEYMKSKCCYNVILVDWMWGNGPDLISGKNNMPIVAEQVAQLIRNLEEQGLNLKKLQLVGHSYGAHICGMIGQRVKIYAIAGLEPNGVVQGQYTPLDQRLDPSDAECVQIFHCNAGQCLPEFFGQNFSSGHLDFWFNDGLHQPACRPDIVRAFKEGDFIYMFLNLYPAACNHFECVKYFAASINACDFVGVKCKNIEEFLAGKCRSCGYDNINEGCGGNQCATAGVNGCRCPHTHKPPPNNYYLTTTDNCPYCDNLTSTDGYSCCPDCVLTSSIECKS